MIAEHYSAGIQVPSSHYGARYDNLARWSSYWIQIDEGRKFANGSLLEVGIGNGIVTDYLRKMVAANITTVDIDPALDPDVTADIARLPFKNNTFDCVMACEVLEHMPFERSELALREMRRVANHAIVSVPNSGFCAQAHLTIGWRSLPIQISLPQFHRHSAVRVPKEHYWELEMIGYPETRLRAAFSDAGWQVTRAIRNPNNLFHHFFILTRAN